MEENEYITLIVRHLNKEASAAEEAGLQSWLDADPQNRQEYEAIGKIWRDSGKTGIHHEFDTEAALQKMEARLVIPPATIRPAPSLPAAGAKTSLPFLRRNWPAAAVIAAAVLTGGWYFTHFHPSESHRLYAGHTALQVALPDGSLIDLRKGATLKYTGAFAGDKDRLVELSGEAFFQPAKNALHPFRIRTAHALIEDIGTSFLVKGGSNEDEVTVATGKVKITGEVSPSDSRILLPGQKALLSAGQVQLSRVEGANFISWKTGILDFRSEPLEEVIEDISAYYQVPVSLAPDLRTPARKIRVTARFDHQPLNEVLEEIRLTTGLVLQHEKDTVVFSRK